MKSIKCISVVSRATRSHLLDVHTVRNFASVSDLPVMTLSKQLEAMVRLEQVEFQLSSGKSICLNSVIQDTKPHGSTIGTVVALHGSPGSHKDFKYITPLLNEKEIRVIGVNFPGYGNTDDHEMLQFDNVERNNYVKAVIEKIGINDKYILMGHSRGCENATGVAAELADSASGLVLVNPTGLGHHRALRPMWVVYFVIWLYDLVYNSILGLRLDTGPRAMNCIRTMSNVELSELRPKIDKLNVAKNLSVLIAYSGKDMLVEVSVSSELADYYHSHSAIKCNAPEGEGDDEVILKMKNLYSSGAKTVSVLFGKDGHFLQKSRAQFIAESIEAIFKRL